MPGWPSHRSGKRGTESLSEIFHLPAMLPPLSQPFQSTDHLLCRQVQFSPSLLAHSFPQRCCHCLVVLLPLRVLKHKSLHTMLLIFTLNPYIVILKICIRPLWKSGLHKDKIQKRREGYTAVIKLMVLYLGVTFLLLRGCLNYSSTKSQWEASAH